MVVKKRYCTGKNHNIKEILFRSNNYKNWHYRTVQVLFFLQNIPIKFVFIRKLYQLEWNV